MLRLARPAEIERKNLFKFAQNVLLLFSFILFIMQPAVRISGMCGLREGIRQVVERLLMACLFCLCAAILEYHIWILLVSLTEPSHFARGSNTCPAYCAGIFYIWLIDELIGWYKRAAFVKVEGGERDCCYWPKFWKSLETFYFCIYNSTRKR